MKLKKSQITAFIILGIILLVAVATVFFIRNYIISKKMGLNAEEILEEPFKKYNLNQFLSNKIEVDINNELDNINDVTNILVELQEEKFETDFGNVPIGIPSKSAIESQLANYLGDYLSENPIEIPLEFGQCEEIKRDDIKVKATINQDSADFSVSYKIKCGKTKLAIEKTFVKENFRLGRILDVAESISYQISSDCYFFDVTQLTDIADTQNFKFAITPYEKTVVSSIVDTYEKSSNPYVFSFATQC